LIEKLSDINTSKAKWLILLLCLLIYGNSVFNDYNLDDELVTINHKLTSKGIAAIPEIFTSPYYSDERGFSYEYRPMVHVTFAIEHQIFGDNPQVSHSINLMLFFFTSLLFYHILISVFPAAGSFFAATATLLFIIHPMHTEVVCSIKNRDELLSLLGGLAALYTAILFSNNGKWLWLAISTVSLLAGMLSKLSAFPFAVIIPFILALRGTILPRILSVVLLYAIVSLAILILKGWAALSAFYVALLLVLAIVLFNLVYNRFYLLKNAALSVSIRLKASVSLGMAHLMGDTIANRQHKGNPLLYYLFHGVLFLLLCAVLLLAGNYQLNTISILLFVFLVSATTLFAAEGNYFLYLYAAVLIILSPFVAVNISLTLFFIYLWFLFTENRNDAQHLRILMALLLLALTVNLTFYNNARSIDYFYKLPFFLFFPLHFWLKNKYSHSVFVKIFWFALFAFVLGIILVFNNRMVLEYPAFILLCGLFFISSARIKKVFLVATCAASFLFLCYHTSSYSAFKMKLPAFTKNLKAELKNVPDTLPQPIQHNEYAGKLAVQDRPLDFVEFPLGFKASFTEKTGTAFMILGRYLKLMILPVPMSFYYGYSIITTTELTRPAAFIPLLIYLLLAVFAVVLLRTHTPFSVGIIIYLLCIFPYSNLVFPLPGMMADRFTYVASAGYCMAFAYLLSWLYNYTLRINWQRYLLYAAMTLLAGAYTFITINRNNEWKNHITLMGADIPHLQNAAQAQNVYAYYLTQYSLMPEFKLQSINMKNEAVKHFEQALRIYPGFFNAKIDLAGLYLNLNEIDKAYKMYVSAYLQDTTYHPASLNAALCAEALGKNEDAIYYYNKLLQVNPNMKEGYNNLSYLYFRMDSIEKSIEVNQKAIAHNPSWKEPYENLSKTYMMLNDTVNAQKYYRLSLQH